MLEYLNINETWELIVFIIVLIIVCETIKKQNKEI